MEVHVSQLSAAEFEERIQRAFSILRDNKRPKQRLRRARLLVPWMSKAQLYDRFKKNDSSRKVIGRPPMLGPTDLEKVATFVKAQYDVGKPVSRLGVKKKLAALAATYEFKTDEFTRARQLKRFLSFTNTKTVLGQKTDTARFFSVTEDSVGRFGDLTELAVAGVDPDNIWVCDEAGFMGESHDRTVSCAPRRLESLEL
jgi:hypothetical protein